ncbi:hypothetical protein M422DRAFT_262027 [Sphaerobolus stellatus SS14]|uniref:Uncharacterized protein n=1 Tax=Sphaerobolus stellatus (strain SS14) TaxID=990650 RepID=A0A0C9TYT7_SPHS4|nr:hypothetical protein M422DRAFT_262027 [Sphaerobolus stellatus SS14]
MLDPTNWEIFLVNAAVLFSLFGSWSSFDTTGHLNVTLGQGLTARSTYQSRAVNSGKVDLLY